MLHLERRKTHENLKNLNASAIAWKTILGKFPENQVRVSIVQVVEKKSEKTVSGTL